MLEKYEKDFDENEFMRSFMERKQISTKKQALAELRKLIKKEGYYQTKIKEALKKRYPDAFVAKISQGAYSQAGIPDVMFIKDGHYFGFEVKRPVVGIRSKLQEQTARMIQAAEKYPLVLFTHMADQMATSYLETNTGNKKPEDIYLGTEPAAQDPEEFAEAEPI